MTTKTNQPKPKQPNVTRIYHVPGGGTIVEHLYSKPAQAHRLTAADKQRMQELKRREGLYDEPSPKNVPATRVVTRKGGKWAQKKAQKRKRRAG